MIIAPRTITTCPLMEQLIFWLYSNNNQYHNNNSARQCDDHHCQGRSSDNYQQNVCGNDNTNYYIHEYMIN